MTITTNVPKPLLRQLLQLFPNNLSFAFAYGSGVFNQSIDENNNNTKTKDSSPNKNMIDLILVTDDSFHFHYHNLIKNRSHYSSLGSLGAKWLASIQDNFGANVYFNTLIPYEDYLIKYGVISTKHLINDCIDWNTLYISGRLHKPVAVLKESNSSELSTALKVNIENALHSALLLLSETFTEEQLYTEIAGLSYLGDFRMTFGEDRDKVRKIVRPQINNFRHIYQPLLTSDTLSQIVKWNPNSQVFAQDCRPDALFYHLNLLPKTLENFIVKEWNRDDEFTDVDDLLKSMAHSIECKTFVREAIYSIVKKSSISQSFKGVFSAGLIKSFRYSSQKVFKMYKSVKN